MWIVEFMLQGLASLAFWRLQFFDNYQSINGKVERLRERAAMILLSVGFPAAILVPSRRLLLNHTWLWNWRWLRRKWNVIWKVSPLYNGQYTGIIANKNQIYKFSQLACGKSFIVLHVAVYEEKWRKNRGSLKTKILYTKIKSSKNIFMITEMSTGIRILVLLKKSLSIIVWSLAVFQKLSGLFGIPRTEMRAYL
jgi:hypothetical protein